MIPMEPRIQYATTPDGVSIAYWDLGDGPIFLNPPPASPWSHAQMEWQIPDWRHWYEHLTRHLRVIRYDNRGSGLSDRDVDGWSLDTNVVDLEAVADAAGAERFALFGMYYSACAAIQYAALHPERVSHLILWCGFARADDAQAATNDAMRALLDVDWTLFTETLAHSVFGWSQGEPAHAVAEYMRASTSPDLVRRAWGAQEALDLTPLLAQIQAPTLVMHRRQFPFVKLETARDLVARIPDARLAIFEGDSLSPYLDDMEDIISNIFDFVGVDRDGGSRARIAPRLHAPQSSVGFRTIMFTDMEGSTATTQRLGDAQAQAVVRLHNEIVRDALHAYSGTEVKHTGDGIMSSFTSASLAVECAIAIQRAMQAHAVADPDGAISVRIGINAGEPVAEGDDLFGTAVQLAARICARAEPRQILVSDVVRQLVAGKGFLFGDGGETELRGFEDPVRIFEVRWQEQQS